MSLPCYDAREQFLKGINLLPYILVALSISCLLIIDRKNYDSVVFIIVAFILTIFTSFRYGGFSTGDYFTYISFSQLVTSFDNVINPNIPVEIGFRFLSYIGNVLYLPENFIIVIMGFLSVLPVVYVIAKYSEYKFFSLFLFIPYLFTMNMHSARTSVAAGMGLLLIVFFFERKFLKSIFCFLMALSFHNVSMGFIFLPLTLFPLNFLVGIFFIIFLLVMFFNPIIILTQLISSVGLDSISNKISAYSQSELFGGSLSLFDPRAVVMLMVVMFFLHVRNRMYRSIDYYFGKVFIVGGITMYLFSSLVIVSWRLSYLFLLSGLILIPSICYLLNAKIYYQIHIKRVLTFFFFCVYLLWILALISKSQPYGFILWPSSNIT